MDELIAEVKRLNAVVDEKNATIKSLNAQVLTPGKCAGDSVELTPLFCTLPFSST